MDIQLDTFIYWISSVSFPEGVIKGTDFQLFTAVSPLTDLCYSWATKSKTRQLYYARTMAGHWGPETIVICTDHVMAQVSEIFILSKANRSDFKACTLWFFPQQIKSIPYTMSWTTGINRNRAENVLSLQSRRAGSTKGRLRAVPM